MKHHRYILYGAFCAVLLIIMFLLSHQPGEVSYAISDHLGDLIRQFATDHSVDLSGVNFRKIAHVVLYFLLGLSAMLLFLGILRQRKPGSSYLILISSGIAFIFCVMAAAFDEWHQTFIPGRNGRIGDIFLDAVSSGIAILIAGVIGHRLKSHKGLINS